MDIYEVKDTDIVYSAAVDFGTRTCSKEVHIVQYDNSLPIVAVKLYSSGGYYVLPSGYEANLRFGKKDKTFIYKPVLGCDKTRTTVYFVVDEQMSLIAGSVYPIIELTYNGSVVGSSPITFIIDRNPIQIGDIESKSDYPAIVERISAAETKATNAETLAEEAKASADDARDRMIDIDKTYATKVELSEEKTRAITRENEIEQKISQTGKIDDVQVNGESVVQDRVANINLLPYAKSDELPKKLSELENDVGYITENGIAMYDSFDKFPTSGNAANIYLAKDTNYTYRYDSILKTYTEISRPHEELTEVSTDIIVNGKLELIIGDASGAKISD